MKRILTTVLILSVLAVSSCKKDDDAGTSEDPIVGTWKLTKVLVDGKEVSLGECNKNNNYVFEADAKGVDNYYNTVNSECKLFSDSFTWKNNSGGSYTNTYTFEGEEDFEQFTLENNELKLIDNLEDIVDIYTKQ
ncbi:lipocalin family protein [Aquimarina sp. 2201CG1-2-11]|uniref:lipocalin family protein n=1 Tax=Aquimarina discodermiae TaxID=3231043 RepID=UPI0034628A06